ncbi:WD40-repeat-containing domain protein [Pelagophyceae sp. CCMP2097]|nr:WD40-repeat-containing domain protein [Pelagophyceae sp. CCMP2097]|mmetsp:Transcript_30816/g.106540  ORF Transcript_30816/g.106540 Transcript_30816/m.106540 type:complete len:362 (+) Transcript_30816:120-1205(+)
MDESNAKRARGKAGPEWSKGTTATAAGHGRTVTSLDWNRAGTVLASGSEDKTARLWQFGQGSEALKSVGKLEGHGDSVVQLCWDPSSDKSVATLAADRTVRLWDARAKSGATPRASIKVVHEYINVAWAPDGRTIAVGSSVGAKDESVKDCVSLIDVRKLKVSKVLKFGYEVNEFTWAPDARHLLLTTEHGTVEILKALQDDGGATPSNAQKKIGPPAALHAHTLRAHTDDCYCVSLDHESATLAVGSKDSLVSIWDLYEGACTRVLSSHVTPVRCVSLSNGAEFVASSAYDPGIEIASATSGKRLHFVEAACAMNSLAWHPQHTVLAYALDAKAAAAADRHKKDDDKASHDVRLFAVPRN